ncbi:MAG: hypothetical protein ACO3P3_05895 [Candidatus Nanopelagicales bacterium]
MKKFSEFKTPQLGNLSVWDIDETLFQTKAEVHVMKDGKRVKSLSNKEFNTYKLKKGESYDFTEFRDAKLFKSTSVPIQRAIDKAAKTLKAYSNLPNSKVIVLTARSDFDDPHTFLSTFEKYGLNMRQVHVHRAGNLGLPSAEAKRIFIKQYLDTGKFKSVSLFDDDARNLEVFLSLRKEYPNVKFVAYMATHGYFRKYG